MNAASVCLTVCSADLTMANWNFGHPAQAEVFDLFRLLLQQNLDRENTGVFCFNLDSINEGSHHMSEGIRHMTEGIRHMTEGSRRRRSEDSHYVTEDSRRTSESSHHTSEQLYEPQLCHRTRLLS